MQVDCLTGGGLGVRLSCPWEYGQDGYPGVSSNGLSRDARDLHTVDLARPSLIHVLLPSLMN